MHHDATASGPTGLDLDRHYADIFRLVAKRFGRGKIDVEDLVQDVCAKIHAANVRGAGYDPSRGALSSYVTAVARSVVCDRLRQERSRAAGGCADEGGEEGARWAPQVPEGFDAYLRLRGVDSRTRRVHLLWSMGYTNPEIAALLGESAYGVKQGKARLAALARHFAARQRGA